MNVFPDVRWLTVSDESDSDNIRAIRVEVARAFETDEIIALFWGDVINEKMQPSNYALQSKYGIVDPLQGLTDKADSVHYLAMHLFAEPDHPRMASAEVQESFLITALQPIAKGAEIFFLHCMTKVGHHVYRHELQVPITSWCLVSDHHIVVHLLHSYINKYIVFPQ
jgi:hypothetical protein